jgi:DNA invertase Pin-like site-specific DNA recombinase
MLTSVVHRAIFDRKLTCLRRGELAVYGYVRVSTDRQADDGESLGTQQRVIEGYAMMNGLTLDSIFIERGVSGSKPLGERPKGARLLAVLKAGDVVITPKLDRMFRSALNALDVLGQLKERDVALHMIDLGGDVTGNGISKLVFTILSAVAEAERDRIRERIRDVKADQRKRQRYLGGIVPFGWRIGKDGDLIEVPDQQRAIQRIVELRRNGLSLRAISASVAADGVKLSHEGVKNVLAAVGHNRGDRLGRSHI